jgi:hypothetical protein
MGRGRYEREREAVKARLDAEVEAGVASGDIAWILWSEVRDKEMHMGPNMAYYVIVASVYQVVADGKVSREDMIKFLGLEENNG